MKAKTLRRVPRPQSGVAAVELSVLMLVVMVPLLIAVPLFLGRYFWHYTAIHKAAHDAALYLSRVNQLDMRATGPDGIVAAATLAADIARSETRELNPGGNFNPPPSISCEYQESPGIFSWGLCDGITLPARISVRIRTRVTDPIFTSATEEFSGQPDGLLISSTVTMRYVGN